MTCEYRTPAPVHSHAVPGQATFPMAAGELGVVQGHAHCGPNTQKHYRYRP